MPSDWERVAADPALLAALRAAYSGSGDALDRLGIVSDRSGLNRRRQRRRTRRRTHLALHPRRRSRDDRRGLDWLQRVQLLHRRQAVDHVREREPREPRENRAERGGEQEQPAQE